MVRHRVSRCCWDWKRPDRWSRGTCRRRPSSRRCREFFVSDPERGEIHPSQPRPPRSPIRTGVASKKRKRPTPPILGWVSTPTAKLALGPGMRMKSPRRRRLHSRRTFARRFQTNRSGTNYSRVTPPFNFATVHRRVLVPRRGSPCARGLRFISCLPCPRLRRDPSAGMRTCSYPRAARKTRRCWSCTFSASKLELWTRASWVPTPAVYRACRRRWRCTRRLTRCSKTPASRPRRLS